MSWDISLYNSYWNLRTTELSLKTPQKLCQNLNNLANSFFSNLVVILKPSFNNLQTTLTTHWFSFFAETTAVPAFKDWCPSTSHKVNQHSNPVSVGFGKTNWKVKNMLHLRCYVSCCFKKKLLIWTQVSHLSWWALFLVMKWSQPYFFSLCHGREANSLTSQAKPQNIFWFGLSLPISWENVLQAKCLPKSIAGNILQISHSSREGCKSKSNVLGFPQQCNTDNHFRCKRITQKNLSAWLLTKTGICSVWIR